MPLLRNPNSHNPLRLQPLNEQISRLHEELAAERLSREVMDERKTKEIKTVESTISLDLTQEKRVRSPQTDPNIPLSFFSYSASISPEFLPFFAVP